MFLCESILLPSKRKPFYGCSIFLSRGVHLFLLTVWPPCTCHVAAWASSPVIPFIGFSEDISGPSSKHHCPWYRALSIYTKMPQEILLIPFGKVAYAFPFLCLFPLTPEQQAVGSICIFKFWIFAGNKIKVLKLYTWRWITVVEEVVMESLVSKKFTQWKNKAFSTCSLELGLNLYIKFYLTQDKIATDLNHFYPIV